MKKFIRVFSIYALVPLLIAGFCFGYVWRGNRQHEKDKALIAAIKDNDTPAVIAALKHGADPNARDMPEDTRTLKERFFDLLHHTGPPDRGYDAALYLAASVSPENIPLVKALLDAGADPNAARIDTNSLSSYFGNPLIVAEGWRHYAVAHLLLEHHADIHICDDTGRTPLTIAAGGDNCNEVQYLLGQGANIEETDGGGHSALIVAVFARRTSVVEYLVERGADVNHRDNSGLTALGYNRYSQEYEIEKLLRKAGAVE